MFKESGGVWTETQELIPAGLNPNDPNTPGSALQGDQLGYGGVALDGETVFIGSHFDDNVNGVDAGSVYIYTLQTDTSGASNFVLFDQIFASDGLTNDTFGRQITLKGDRAVVGSIAHWPGGAAYVFDRDSTGDWSQSAKLQPGVGTLDYFGWSTAIDGATVIAGASNNRNCPAPPSLCVAGGVETGAVFVYYPDGEPLCYTDGTCVCQGQSIADACGYCDNDPSNDCPN